MNHEALVLTDVFPPQHGGSGKWLHELYARQTPGQYIIAAGNSHGFDANSDDQYPQKIIRLKLDMPYRGIANLNSLWNYTKQYRLLSNLVEKNPIKKIHAARPLSEGLVAAAIKKTRRIPFYCFIHGEDINVAKTSRELITATNFVLKSADRLIANSNFSRNLLINDWGVADSKTRVLHPGVDTQKFSHVKQRNARDGTLKLLTVGRLQRRKGQDTVIKALPELTKIFPDVSYTIAGGGEDLGRLQNLAEQLGVENRVNFLGSFEDSELPSIYGAHDVFILANRDEGHDVEGFGIVLVEAQAAGLPIIAGNSGGTSDTFSDGETGFLIDAETCEPLVKALTTQLNTVKKRLAIGSRGREHVQKNLDWSTLTKKAEIILA
ncbi:glycosyltransferase family 4 protein [Rhodopirellula sp.]|nr:glycosyltransferase family 4 protein [Rhodopirellula sp.]